jgi:carbon storage regulator
LRARRNLRFALPIVGDDNSVRAGQTFCSTDEIYFKEEDEMLVLTRKEGEQILIGDRIRLTVLSIDGNRVKLGLLAPLDVTILRVELTTRCDGSNESNAAGAEGGSVLPSVC